MRISDWSSDVFSSDLRGSCSSAISIGHRGLRRHPFGGGVHVAGLDLARQPVTVALAIIGLGIVDRRVVEPELIAREPPPADRRFVHLAHARRARRAL